MRAELGTNVKRKQRPVGGISMKPDDMLTLLTGLRALSAHPAIVAACARLKNPIWRTSTRRLHTRRMQPPH